MPSSPVSPSTDSSSPPLLHPKPIEPGRKPSIAFAKLPDEPAQARKSSTHLATSSYSSFKTPSRQIPTTSDRGRSLSSPPPPPTFIKRVSFDTFDNKDAPDFSLTLQAKHKDYSYSRRSRTFLCGHDQNDYSDYALEWLLEELVDDGDEIVCLRVVDKDSKITSESTDSPDGEKEYRSEARRLMEKIIEKNDDEKAISIILEFAIGKVQETIQRMIHIYEPVILIVGTRGRSLGGLQGLLPGSVSKYCLQHSPVPVIVVRPSDKREKKKKKRQADPSRRAYMSILEKSSYDSTFNLLAGTRTPSGNGGDVTPVQSGPVSRRTSGEGQGETTPNVNSNTNGVQATPVNHAEKSPAVTEVKPIGGTETPGSVESLEKPSEKESGA